MRRIEDVVEIGHEYFKKEDHQLKGKFVANLMTI
jgi:hypothetical protein